MAKLTRKEIKEKAAVAMKTMKGWWPEVTQKEMRAIASAIYHHNKA
jgi:hypothetical protein